jgi:hypothetical protein
VVREHSHGRQQGRGNSRASHEVAGVICRRHDPPARAGGLIFMPGMLCVGAIQVLWSASLALVIEVTPWPLRMAPPLFLFPAAALVA